MSNLPKCEKCDGKTYYIQFDRSTANGLLKFTHELGVFVEKCGRGLHFLNADYISCGEWIVYGRDEREVFEADFPGVIREIRKILRNFGG